MIKLIEQLSRLEDVISLGIIRASVTVEQSSDALVEILKTEVFKIESKFTLDNYRNETLNASRSVYKQLGKDPSRYRISSDSLFRRIIKKKGMYYVNNVVDINNIISLKTLWSIGAYDFEKITGSIVYGVGSKEDEYEGIGRGVLNIENLPVLKDDLGPFGSATSDSLRTMVTEDTHELLMVIHAFGGPIGLEESLNEIRDYLERYAKAKNITSFMI